MMHRVPVVVLLFAAVVMPSQASAQEVLRWKFQRDEQLKYNVQQNMETVMVIGENEIKQAMNQSMDMSWNILNVAANGNAVMHQVVKRAQMKMVGGPGGELSFDTANPVKSDNPIVSSMADVFGKIVNQNFTVSMSPNGDIDNVDIPAQLLEAIRTSAAGNTTALNEDTLKQMMKQSAVTLPGNPVSPGSEWSSQQSVQLPFGTMNIRSKMTLVRMEGGNAIIDVVPEISVTPAEGAPVKMSLTSSSGQGQVTFNVATGRVTNSRLDLTMGMKIDSGQRVFNQTIKQTSALTLVR